jgi:hypothetical protein
MATSGGVSHAPDHWPDDDSAYGVAIAARIALFDACRLFPSSQPSADSERIAKLIIWSTDHELVEGHGFRDFLALAKDRLIQDLPGQVRPGLALSRALRAIRRARPVDVTGAMFEVLKECAAVVYGLGALRSVPLARSVVDATGDDHVTGAVRRSRPGVIVRFDLDFDLRSFARLAWVLAHELVCHAAAGHTGAYRAGDDRSTWQYFDEGFMDCTAATLLLTWCELPGMDVLLPASHLSTAEGFAHHSRPQAMEAGRAAWAACRAEVGRRLRSLSPGGGASAPDKTVDATLKLNVLRRAIKEKDRFVARAAQSYQQTLTAFVDGATGAGELERVLDE